MWWVIFYVLFSACFTFGVTNDEDDRFRDIFIKMILSLLAGYVMMPLYLGAWLDLNNRKKN
jgi:hypothetical protein